MFNVHSYLQHLSVPELQDTQKKYSLPYSVAAVHITGDLNISNMIRSAVVFGAKEFIIIGKKRFDRRGCVGAQNYIDIVYYEDQTEALQLIMESYQPVFIEQGGEDICSVDFYGSTKNPCLIFGSESEGLPKEYLEYAKTSAIPVVSIDQIGILRSLNVATAAGIAMWKVAMDLRMPRSWK